MPKKKFFRRKKKIFITTVIEQDTDGIFYITTENYSGSKVRTHYGSKASFSNGLYERFGIFNTKMVHYITVTAIIYDPRNFPKKYLILKRSENKKMFPRMWTVPGGKIEADEYRNRKKDTKECWYNIIESELQREVLEETGLTIGKLEYVSSMVYIRPEINIQNLCISFATKYNIDELIILNDENTEYKWVTLEEAKEYDLIDGIWDEIRKYEENKFLWSKK
jgi:8-oxo-dGTP pyrophosphatase MutT (NUDIX family)